MARMLLSIHNTELFTEISHHKLFGHNYSTRLYYRDFAELLNPAFHHNENVVAAASNDISHHMACQTDC